MVHMAASPVKASDGRSERWRAHKEARRQEFVDAALTAVRSKGAAVRLDDVCAVAKVSKSVIYRHFRDKDDLFAAVLEQIAGEVFLPRIASQLDPDLDDWAMLRAAIGAYVALVSEEPQLYRFVFAYSGVGERGDFVGNMESAIAQALGSMMAERLEAAGRRPGAGEPMAYAMVGMVQLATHRWVDHPTVGADELVELLSDVAWQGLAGALPRP
jgi:AcrR family transcriptional regulator